MNVLIVDDSWAMRKFIRKQIQASGAPVEECFEADHGKQALETVKSRRVDMVFTDINMPEMDGVEMTRALRADPATAAIPVVVVSSDSEFSRRQEFEPLGTMGYLEKPFTPERLRGEVERLLGLAGLLLRVRR